LNLFKVLPVILTLNMKLKELFCLTKICLWTNLNILIGLAVFQTDTEVFTVCDKDSEIYNALISYLFFYGQN